jgi:hypothetical protein
MSKSRSLCGLPDGHNGPHRSVERVAREATTRELIDQLRDLAAQVRVVNGELRRRGK